MTSRYTPSGRLRQAVLAMEVGAERQFDDLGHVSQSPNAIAGRRGARAHAADRVSHQGAGLRGLTLTRDPDGARWRAQSARNGVGGGATPSLGMARAIRWTNGRAQPFIAAASCNAVSCRGGQPDTCARAQ